MVPWLVLLADPPKTRTPNYCPLLKPWCWWAGRRQRPQQDVERWSGLWWN